MPNELQRFSQWVADHRRGELDNELTAALAAVTERVAALGKKGTITLKIDLKANGPNARTIVAVDQVTISEPAPDRESAIYYAGDGGRLTRDDPYQQRFPMRTVEDTQPVEPRRVDD